MIESAKYKYERDLRLPQWVLAIGLTLIFAIESSDFLLDPDAPPILLFIAKAIIFASLGVSLVGISKIIYLVRMQQTSMIWLYREKDKQDSKSNLKNT